MTGFSTDWLALRESTDHRSRSSDVADALQAHFGLRDTLRIVDLGSGTGSNLRGTAELLPTHQQWTLVDYDAALLAAGRVALADWADSAETVGESMRLKKGRLGLEVTFKVADLANDLDAALGETPDLVTASAFFDLVSPAAIGKIARAVTKRRAAFYTLLTYNGIQQWVPRHPSDSMLASSFHHHQRSDKGFGPAAGPTAPAILADRFTASGYRVLEGDSPWNLKAPSDAALINELSRGYMRAAGEAGKVDTAAIAKWGARSITGSVVGHTDTLALPGHNVFMDDPEDDDDEVI